MSKGTGRRSAAIAAAAVAAALALTAAGCGGGGKATPNAAGVTASMSDSVPASSGASPADDGATPTMPASSSASATPPSASPTKAATTTTSHTAARPTTAATAKPTPVNTCAHPLTPAQAAQCPAPHPTDGAPHPRLVGSAGVSCGYVSPTLFRSVARFTFDAIGSDWNVSFSEAGARTSVNGNTVTVTDDTAVLGGGVLRSTTTLSGSVYFVTPGGDTSVPVSVSMTCH